MDEVVLGPGRVERLQITQQCSISETKIFPVTGDMVSWTYPNPPILEFLISKGAAYLCYDTLRESLKSTVVIPNVYYGKTIIGAGDYTVFVNDVLAATRYFNVGFLRVTPSLMYMALASSNYEKESPIVEISPLAFLYPPQVLLGIIMHEFLHAGVFYMRDKDIETVVRIASENGGMQVYTEVTKLLSAAGIPYSTAEKTAMTLTKVIYAKFYNVVTDALINSLILSYYGTLVPDLLVSRDMFYSGVLNDEYMATIPQSVNLFVGPSALPPDIDMLRYAKTFMKCAVEELNTEVAKYTKFVPYLDKEEAVKLIEFLDNTVDDIIDKYRHIVERLSSEYFDKLTKGYFNTVLGYPEPATDELIQLNYDELLTQVVGPIKENIMRMRYAYALYFYPILHPKENILPLTMRALTFIDFKEPSFAVSIRVSPVCWTLTLYRDYDVREFTVKYGNCAEEKIEITELPAPGGHVLGRLASDIANFYRESKTVVTFDMNERGKKLAVISAMLASEILEQEIKEIARKFGLAFAAYKDNCLDACMTIIISGSTDKLAEALSTMPMDDLAKKVADAWSNYESQISDVDAELMRRCTAWFEANDQKVCEELLKALNKKWMYACVSGGECREVGESGYVTCKPPPQPPTPPSPPSPPPPPGIKPPCTACGTDEMEEPPETSRLTDLLQRIRPPPVEIPRHGPGEEVRTVPREKY